MKIYREVGSLYIVNRKDAEGYERPVYEIAVDDDELTEETIKEYCRKRCLAIVDSGLFNEMKARWMR